MQFWAELPENWAGSREAPGEILSAAQMRAVESAAIAAGATTGAALMEAAGAGVVAAVARHWPEPGRALVLAGPGNNGGDGCVIARLLAARGWAVALFLLGDPARLPPDAAANLHLWAATAPVHRLDGLDDPALAAALAPEMLVVDALFGTGLRRGIDGIAALSARLEAQPLRRVAVDIPSGLHADSGAALGEGALRADLTVTFHAPKLGHVLGEGSALCGRLVVADIGLAGPAEGAARLVAPPEAGRLAKRMGHKYSHGHALVLGGGPGHGGAARLAARAALRIGAGLVTLAPPPEAIPENAARLDAVMLAPVADTAALAVLLGDRRLNAVALGPGLGHQRARDLVPAVLATGRAAVLDADAISGFAGDPAALLALLHPAAILTPHEGEFARLFPTLAARLADPAANRVEIARKAAARAGCTLLLKGPATVIAAPDGRASVHVAAYGWAAPWLATAGAGDVLTGMIAGLMARGLAPMPAAEAATWLHAAAARRFGPGLIAEDLPEALPGVLAELLTT